jgi:CRP/FNR family transcriptional regulator
VDADGLDRLDAIAERLILDADQPLVREGDQARHVFNIISGSVRVYRLMPDGRRQIVGFLFAGDFLGLSAGDAYAFSAEALEPTTACRFIRSEYRALVRELPTLEAALLDRAGHELAAAQAQMLLLGRKTAIERLASFILALPGMDPSRPGPSDQVRLPMTRSEIADYLGLTIETVSRTLGRLKAQGVVRLVSLNLLQVLRPETLRALAEDGA